MKQLDLFIRWDVALDQMEAEQTGDPLRDDDDEYYTLRRYSWLIRDLPPEEREWAEERMFSERSYGW